MLLSLLAFGAYAGYSQKRFGELGDAVQADIATYERQRWARPVLRGTALDGNAAEAARALIATLPRLNPSQRDALAESVYYVKPLGEQQKNLISKHRATLAKIRAATRRAFAMTVVDLERGDAMEVPDYPAVMDAVLMLLSTGLTYEPRDCFELGTDVIRLGQDLVPGATLEAASVAARVTSVAVPLVTSCAARAGYESLHAATLELHLLAKNPPPVGGGIEVADIVSRVELLRQGDLLADGLVGAVGQLGRRSGILDAFGYLDEPTRWREISPANYPEALETWKSEHDFRNRASQPQVAVGTAGALGFLYDDMRGQALLRAMTVGIATLAERSRRGSLPTEPVSLHDRTLRDPYTGQPLLYRVTDDGSELSIWSVGEDMRDDGGSSDWGLQAPVDVVVHFKLVAPQAALPASGGRLSRKARARARRRSD